MQVSVLYSDSCIILKGRRLSGWMFCASASHTDCIVTDLRACCTDTDPRPCVTCSSQENDLKVSRERTDSTRSRASVAAYISTDRK